MQTTPRGGSAGFRAHFDPTLASPLSPIPACSAPATPFTPPTDTPPSYRQPELRTPQATSAPHPQHAAMAPRSSHSSPSSPRERASHPGGSRSASPASVLEPSDGEIPTVSLVAAGMLGRAIQIAAPRVWVVDVRPSLRGGHIVGSMHLPFQLLRQRLPSLVESVGTLPGAVVFLCADGYSHSPAAATLFLETLCHYRAASGGLLECARVSIAEGGCRALFRRYAGDRAVVAEFDASLWGAFLQSPTSTYGARGANYCERFDTEDEESVPRAGSNSSLPAFCDVERPPEPVPLPSPPLLPQPPAKPPSQTQRPLQGISVPPESVPTSRKSPVLLEAGIPVSHAVEIIQRSFRRHISRVRAQLRREERIKNLEDEERYYGALRIQARFRGICARARVRNAKRRKESLPYLLNLATNARVFLREGRTRVGTSHEMDWVLDGALEPHHCTIRRNGPDCTLETTALAFINGSRVEGDTVLSVGCRITLGFDVSFRFLLQQPDETQSPPVPAPRTPTRSEVDAACTIQRAQRTCAARAEANRLRSHRAIRDTQILVCAQPKTPGPASS
eukprot:TRINITY_DN2273_c0_g1_i1.p1 TRINITY_DN2273_c0_g1~~TRINITY_DN2273_c0_g1_i1.p1  ORF type:complete len:563 (+),score=37.73 TRINITY_DN2273_c0_g1_i1:48-1736(+)